MNLSLNVKWFFFQFCIGFQISEANVSMDSDFRLNSEITLLINLFPKINLTYFLLHHSTTTILFHSSKTSSFLSCFEMFSVKTPNSSKRLPFVPKIEINITPENV